MSLALDIFTPVQAAILYGIVAVLGACLGSFVNCLAWRLVNGESVTRGRSHCTSCNHVLGPLDLVPVVSYFVLRGKCRHCGTRVSPRYVVVELVMALAFVALLAVYGVGLAWVVYAVLACILMAAALVDLDTFTIPNGFVIAAAVTWALMMVASIAGLITWPLSNSLTVAATEPFGMSSMFAYLVGSGWLATLLDGLAGAVCVGGGILLFSLVFDALTKTVSLGGGDVKLLFAVGLFLGLAGSLLNLLVACIAGLVFALIRGLSSTEAKSLRTKAIPFGPAIAAATLFTLLVGSAVLTWYTGLF